jgi:hypothetical protein
MKISPLILTAIATIGLASAAFAEDKKEVTLTGEAKCAKCALGEGDKCQSVLQTEKDGKTTTYYLMGDTAKSWHSNICQGTKKAKVIGTVQTKDGKEEVNVSKIEEVKS